MKLITKLLGAIPRSKMLGIGGAVLTSGGAVGLSHSFTEILRQAGAVCYVPTEQEFSAPRKREGGVKSQLDGGHSYLGVAKNEKFLDVTNKIKNNTINSICSN